ncbi:MAG: hypothetical protein LBV04_07305 [Deferribacteraceae bacterium]|jgi:CRP-like cAMP-binding protein|nr:hypothetical protein [Deferribacteraceae bacterium]
MNYALLGSYVTDEVAEFFTQHGSFGHARKKAYLHAPREKSLLYITDGIAGSVVTNNNLSKANLLKISMPGFICNAKLFANKDIITAAPFAITDCDFYKLDVDEIAKLLDGDYAKYQSMVSFFGRDMGCCIESLFIMLTLTAETRLRILMRSLTLCTGQSEASDWLAIPQGITREQYAMSIYITTNTLDGILQEWKNLGVYKKDGVLRYIHKCLIENVYHPADNFTERLYNEDWKLSAPSYT